MTAFHYEVLYVPIDIAFLQKCLVIFSYNLTKYIKKYVFFFISCILWKDTFELNIKEKFLMGKILCKIN